MKEKVTFNYANGESSEKALIAHFKTIDDLHPNIKNMPVMVVDKNEFNNGNKVLEFYYQKDGLYQPIIDEAAWKETKGVITDIIKNNFKMSPNGNETTYLVSLDGNSFMANVAEGKLLALTETQVGSLESHFNTCLEEFKNSSAVSASINDISEVAPVELAPAPEVPLEAMNPLNNDINLINPVSDNAVENNSIVTNEVPLVDTPVISNVGETTPVINEAVMDVNSQAVVDMPVTEAPVIPSSSVLDIASPVNPEMPVNEVTPQIDLNAPITEIPVVGGAGSDENVSLDNFLIQDDATKEEAPVFDFNNVPINESTPVVEEPITNNLVEEVPVTNEVNLELSSEDSSLEDKIASLDKQINDLMIEKMKLINQLANK